jgi:hypothetical protein
MRCSSGLAGNDGSNSQKPVFLVGVPIGFFLLERRRSRLSPQCVVPGDCLQSVVAGLKYHRWVSGFAFNVIELDGDLASRICPVSKRSDRAFASVLCYGSRSIRTEADAECRSCRRARIARFRRFRTVDAGIFGRGKCGSCNQRQYNRGAGYYKLQMGKSGGSHNVSSLRYAHVKARCSDKTKVV